MLNSINLTAFCCCRSCCGAHGEQRGMLRLGRFCRVRWRFFFYAAITERVSLQAKKQTKKQKLSKNRNVITHPVVGFHRAVKTLLVYHELFGCYVPSLWTLRSVRPDCSCFNQQLTGKKWADIYIFIQINECFTFSVSWEGVLLIGGCFVGRSVCSSCVKASNPMDRLVFDLSGM